MIEGRSDSEYRLICPSLFIGMFWLYVSTWSLRAFFVVSWYMWRWMVSTMEWIYERKRGRGRSSGRCLSLILLIHVAKQICEQIKWIEKGQWTNRYTMFLNYEWLVGFLGFIHQLPIFGIYLGRYEKILRYLIDVEV